MENMSAKCHKRGYEEAVSIPRAPVKVVETAIEEAVKSGIIWLIAAPASIFKEPIPLGLLTQDAILNPPPEEIPATALLPQNLPTPWEHDTTTASAISTALSVKYAKSLPWTVVAPAIEAAIRGRLLEVVTGSGTWPCEWPGVGNVRLQVPMGAPPSPPPPEKRMCAEAELQPSELQDFVEGMGDILKAGAGLNLRLVLRVEVGKEKKPSGDQLSKLNDAMSKACSKLKFG